MGNFMTNEEILQRVDYLLKDHFEMVATSNDEHTKQVAEVQSRALIASKDQHREMYRQYLDAHVGTFTTIRERFAGMAMQGLLGDCEYKCTYQECAESSVRYADALIAELERTK